MCGIAGLLTAGRADPALVRRMIAPIAHRGPDDQGVWTDGDAGIGLGHRRLSIVDLSPLGHQPMLSADGRWMLSYNGEIYNHLALRAELPAVAWRGHSDTETLVECIAAWGLEATLRKAVGMFAIALWDRQRRELALARDRFGEKPLYYGWAGKDFVFGSELKALREHPRFSAEIDRRALRLYAARTYIPAPFSIYRGVYKLEPGCILTVTPAAADGPPSGPPREGAPEAGLSLARYWSYRDVMRHGLADPIGDEGEALERLERVLAEAIGGQAVADVPVGAFLSGGIDSSTVVALYQKYSSIPVRTFSIGFEEAGFNEAEYAKAVAKHLGTVHHERYVTVRETRDVIPLLPAMYDEPFADSSQIPTHLVSRFAREQVTVALSGDGGDELFAGYNRHFAAPALWRRLSRLPRPVRAMLGGPLSQLPSSLWSGAGSLLPGRRQPHFGSKVKKALRVAGSARSFDDVYTSFLDEWSFEPSPVRGAEGGEAGFDMDFAPGAPDTLRMMYCDATSYLPDDILCKVDRAAMAVSLETRVPFLDHRVAELAARIPMGMKVRGGKGKHILRELLYREAPRALFERPKAGFGIPVGEWIKGSLRPWAEELLDRGRMAGEGFFDADIVQRRWQEHLSGRRDSTPALWAVLMFQAWHRQEPESRREAA
ncbi:MAG: asparagine synthase (glutamine-hydrolyzing) [Alphaproteobacteria bacterium]|nr:asparagine synthase (glutamine-hydrolyzing) [Alphaproteobacteria bacterium]MBV9372923.1 asparagine synthase (glutamine-hydrolyzing) [Alphaproteobacteria bacterium]MBV9900958.1 asparagine synthase (glutamine-hydrolyzing) [Alphaproteobacteria bacterium]